MAFVHLHTHSHYSILQWLPQPSDYVKKAKELGMTAVALTDSNNIHGCLELYKAAKKEGIKPILGTQLNLLTIENTPSQIILLAKNFNGYQNILSLVSKAHLSESGAVQWEDFIKYTSDIIALSWGWNSEFAQRILSGEEERRILENIELYQKIFDGDFYLEIMFHEDMPKQSFLTQQAIYYHENYGIKIVATNSTYYIEENDKKTQDIIVALWTGHTIENPDRPTFINGDYSFLCEEDMQALFGFLPKAIHTSWEIADQIDIDIPMGNILIPTFHLPETDQEKYEIWKNRASKEMKIFSTDEWYLRYLSFTGLTKRYDISFSDEEIFLLLEKKDIPWLTEELTKTLPDELERISKTFFSQEKIAFLQTLSNEIQEKIHRIEYELFVVHEMGFDGYFLIVADYIGWAKSKGIPVWPWRGSVAGSLMAYVTGITDIDPLEYALLFERFLNPARISMPDIDVDFADDERDSVIEYCRGKYGSDHVAQICTFGTFAARAAVKDVGRVMGYSFADMNALAKFIPEKPGTKLKNALEESIEFKDAYENNPQYREIIDNALKIEWNVRQIGVHACAVIIAPSPMTDYTALSRPPKDPNAIITQYSAYPLEDLGLLKMDFLGLRNLTIIKRALKIIENNKQVSLDILTIPRDDQKVFDVFSAGDTTGVFQFESEGMRKYLMDLKPNTFEDIIAMVSLYRPGPMAYIPSYIARKNGEKVEYMLPKLVEILQNAKYSSEQIEEERKKLDADLWPILDVTYGIAIYQEQLMFIVQRMAGFSLAEADMLRRGVGKKIKEVVEKIKGEFIEKSKEYHNYFPQTSQFIYEEMIEPAANYSFNKSHAACYAFIAYQTAYLKAYYKTEFLTSVMVSDEENIERIVLEVGECRTHGIQVLSPDINESMKHFTYINDETIRFGLKAIKWVGDGPIDAIRHARKWGKFTSLQDFIERAGKDVMNKKTLESLILSGALDQFEKRGVMYKNLENILAFSKIGEKQKETNQISFFDTGEKEVFTLEEVEDFSFEERIVGEQTMIGFPISGHPLDGLSKYIKKMSQNDKILSMSFEEIEKLPPAKKSRTMSIKTVWYITDIRKMMTKTWGTMVFLMCESDIYDFEVTIFQKDAPKYLPDLEVGKFVIVTGGISVNEKFGRKTILTREMKVVSLSFVREHARRVECFLEDVPYDFTKKMLLHAQVTQKSHEIPQENNDTVSQDFENISDIPENDNLWENIHNGEEYVYIPEEFPLEDTQGVEKKYVIPIDSHTPRQLLHDLKAFLESQPKGDIEIFLLFGEQEIDTKIALNSLESLKDWEKKNL